MATLDFQLELGFPRKNCKYILGGNPTSHFSQSHETVCKKLKATLGYQLGFPQRCQGNVLMATLDFQLELGFPRKNFKDILSGNPTFHFSQSQDSRKHLIKFEGNPSLSVRVSTNVIGKRFDGNPRLSERSRVSTKNSQTFSRQPQDF